MTPAQKKLDDILKRTGGGELAADKSGVSVRTLRDLRNGAQARARTIVALARIGISPSDWHAAPALDLDALEADELPADASDLLPRLQALYADPELAITERIRAASIALTLARRMPAGPALRRLEDFTRDLCKVDPTLRGLCQRHIRAATEVPENPATDVLAWARGVARDRDTPDRAVTLAHALEARAQRVVSEMARPADDGLGALASEIVKLRKPVSDELAAVLEKYGQEPRPFAPGVFNVTGQGYAALCAKNGWRPRVTNPAWTLGPDGFLVCSE